MKVKELKSVLEGFSDDTEVLASCDAEGNRIGPLWCVQEEWIIREGRQVDVVAPEDVGTEYEESDCEKAVVVWPG